MFALLARTDDEFKYPKENRNRGWEFLHIRRSAIYETKPSQKNANTAKVFRSEKRGISVCQRPTRGLRWGT